MSYNHVHKLLCYPFSSLLVQAYGAVGWGWLLVKLAKSWSCCLCSSLSKFCKNLFQAVAPRISLLKWCCWLADWLLLVEMNQTCPHCVCPHKFRRRSEVKNYKGHSHIHTDDKEMIHLQDLDWQHTSHTTNGSSNKGLWIEWKLVKDTNELERYTWYAR